MDHTLILEAIHEAEIGLVLTVGGWILMFPVRTLIEKIKKFFEDFEAKLNAIENELSTQRTNCLATLQSQGVTQIAALERAANTLDKMHESQIEMTGYFKGMNRG